MTDHPTERQRHRTSIEGALQALSAFAAQRASERDEVAGQAAVDELGATLLQLAEACRQGRVRRNDLDDLAARAAEVVGGLAPELPELWSYCDARRLDWVDANAYSELAAVLAPLADLSIGSLLLEEALADGAALDRAATIDASIAALRLVRKKQAGSWLDCVVQAVKERFSQGPVRAPILQPAIQFDAGQQGPQAIETLFEAQGLTVLASYGAIVVHVEGGQPEFVALRGVGDGAREIPVNVDVEADRVRIRPGFEESPPALAELEIQLDGQRLVLGPFRLAPRDG